MKKTGNRILLAILLIVIAAGCFYLMNYLFDHTELVPELFTLLAISYMPCCTAAQL